MDSIELKYIKRKPVEMIERSQNFLSLMQTRRSIRHFSSEPVPLEIITNAIQTAATAPSGANKQPWKFVVIKDKRIKKKIRLEAEKIESDFYKQKAPESWLQDLAPLGTGSKKSFLEQAPYLIVVFKEIYNQKSGVKTKNYWVNESMGITCGYLITALHNAGLVTLTYTPTRMHFLHTILKRPDNEKPYMIFPVGYPSETTKVPRNTKKSLEDICVVI